MVLNTADKQLLSERKGGRKNNLFLMRKTLLIDGLEITCRIGEVQIEHDVAIAFSYLVFAV